MGDELTGIDLRTDQHREVARLLQRHLPDTEVWAYGSRVKGALNQHLFKVKGKEHPLWFFAGWVHQHMPEFCAIAKNKTTTMGYIKKEHLSQAQCIGPGQKVLKKLEVCIAQLLNRQIFVQQESRALAELRDTLLPKLLSGEILIPNAKIAYGEKNERRIY